ncbi:MAG: hypothetical protein ACRCX2_20820 [Paraclostridium sp.]
MKKFVLCQVRGNSSRVLQKGLVVYSVMDAVEFYLKQIKLYLENPSFKDSTFINDLGEQLAITISGLNITDKKELFKSLESFKYTYAKEIIILTFSSGYTRHSVTNGLFEIIENDGFREREVPLNLIFGNIDKRELLERLEKVEIDIVTNMYAETYLVDSFNSAYGWDNNLIGFIRNNSWKIKFNQPNLVVLCDRLGNIIHDQSNIEIINKAKDENLGLYVKDFLENQVRVNDDDLETIVEIILEIVNDIINTNDTTDVIKAILNLIVSKVTSSSKKDVNYSTLIKPKDIEQISATLEKLHPSMSVLNVSERMYNIVLAYVILASFILESKLVTDKIKIDLISEENVIYK